MLTLLPYSNKQNITCLSKTRSRHVLWMTLTGTQLKQGLVVLVFFFFSCLLKVKCCCNTAPLQQDKLESTVSQHGLSCICPFKFETQFLCEREKSAEWWGDTLSKCWHWCRYQSFSALLLALQSLACHINSLRLLCKAVQQSYCFHAPHFLPVLFV